MVSKEEDLDDLLDEFSGEKGKKQKGDEDEESPKKKTQSKDADELENEPSEKDTKKKKKVEDEKDEEEDSVSLPKASEGISESKEDKSKTKKKSEEKVEEDFLGDLDETDIIDKPSSKKEAKEEKRQERMEERKKVTRKEEFDYSEDTSPATANLCIYAHKGKGKTSLAFSALGIHDCISFDNKSKVIRDNLPEKERKRIRVFSGRRYLNKSSAEAYTESAIITWRYIKGLIDTFNDPDWVDVDGGEQFEKVAEQVMRYNQGLSAFEGFANKNLWKERRLVIGQMFDMCQRKAKNGVIWTTYIDKDKIIKNGEIVTEKDVPRWIDAVMEETDAVIKVETDEGSESGKVEYYATVESSKIPKEVCKRIFGGILKVGIKVNITNRGFDALIEKPKGITKEDE